MYHCSVCLLSISQQIITFVLHFRHLDINWSSLVTQTVRLCLNIGDLGSIPAFGRSLGVGHGNPLQYSCLENLHGLRSLARSCLSSWPCWSPSQAAHEVACPLIFPSHPVICLPLLTLFLRLQALWEAFIIMRSPPHETQPGPLSPLTIKCTGRWRFSHHKHGGRGKQ